MDLMSYVKHYGVGATYIYGSGALISDGVDYVVG